MFTKEDLKLIEKHLPTIKTIIRNQSFSQIDNEFKMDIYTIAENNGISYCRTCNGSLYTTIGNIWLRYNKEIMEKAKNKNGYSEAKQDITSKNGYSEAKQDITSNNEVKRSNENGEGNKKESRGSRGRRSK